MTIEDIKEYYSNRFEKIDNVVVVDKKETKEIRNVKYSLEINRDSFRNLDKQAPLQEELIERNFVIEKSLEVCENHLFYDLHSRRASFVNNYDLQDNHCISYFHFYYRNETLYLNVYCGRMNFDTNFMFDNQTFVLAYKKVFNNFEFHNMKVEYGSIDVHIMSLHKITE